MGTSPENQSREAQQAKVTELGRAYADALLSADEGAAEIAIREAMDAGLDTAQIDDEIIAPALWRIGDRAVERWLCRTRPARRWRP